MGNQLEYRIHYIKERTELERCPVFYVNQFNWGGEYRPKAYGQMGYMDGEGFYLHMICEEKDPVCHYENDSDPVYLDSAMEAFFALDPSTNHYFNFEFNSKGALLAKFGNSRHGRTFFTKEELDAIKRKVIIGPDKWEITLFFPEDVMRHYFPDLALEKGSRIRLNFFKLAEGEEMTHFASYAPIKSPKPDFHLPEFFAEGVLV